jgi:hypothetical protein
VLEMHFDGSSAGLRVRPLNAGQDQAVEEVSQRSIVSFRWSGRIGVAEYSWIVLGCTSVRDSTTPAIKTNDQHVEQTRDQDQGHDQDQQSYRHPSQSQSRTSESPDKSINPIGGTSGQSRSNSFTGVGAAGPSYDLRGSGASLSAYSLAQPTRHQHHNKNQNFDPYLQSETPKSSNSNSNSTPGSGSDHNNNNKPILPQPRRFPSIGTVFGYGESSALNDRLSTARPIDRENLTTLPLPGDAPNPLGILAEATISLDPGSSSGSSLPSLAYNRGGKANNKDSNNNNHNRPPPEGTDYYSSSKKSVTPRTLKSEAPHIMQLISPSDAESLFETYWKKIHPHLPVLDRKRSACIDVASRSNYLFNASESCCDIAGLGGWRLLS